MTWFDCWEVYLRSLLVSTLLRFIKKMFFFNHCSRKKESYFFSFQIVYVIWKIVCNLKINVIWYYLTFFTIWLGVKLYYFYIWRGDGGSISGSKRSSLSIVIALILQWKSQVEHFYQTFTVYGLFLARII